jgi:tRNA (mo5U34)-methyltransferase
LPELAVDDRTHVSFESFLASELDRCAAECPEWADVIAGCSDRYSEQAHGDFPIWRRATEQLRAAGDNQAALRALMPWRKGPWTFGDLDIETEWRSDWKWERLQPHFTAIQGTRILDVGCGNGYFGWQMLKAGARSVIGIDPTLLYCMQHLAAVKLLGTANNWVLPLTLESSPHIACFDGVLSMGVLYHRKDPLDHIRELAACCAPGGTVIVESLIVAGDTSLIPPGRYARMRNISVIPCVVDVQRWMRSAGLIDPRVVDITPTTVQEQRSTSWMTFESLPEALDPFDPAHTIEGHPAPVRAIFIATRPVTTVP